MKFKVVKDKNLRNKFKNSESKIKLLKSIYQNMYIKGKEREKGREKLNKYKGLEFKIKNRCIMTGRAKGVLRDFKISRIELKKNTVKGIIIGIKKASW